MNKVLQDILSQALCDDPALMHEAALELALLIEKHSPRRDSEDFYKSMLRPELVSIVLTEDEVKELIGEIGRIVLSDKCTPTMVWALSKSTSLEALEYLLAFLCSDGPQRGKESIWQAMVGTQIFSTVQRDDAIYDKVFRLFQEYKLEDSLRRAGNEYGGEEAILAQRILDSMAQAD